jgi:hypothetical protein
LSDVVGERAAQELARVRALDVDDLHVRDVEQARAGTHRVVLLHLRAVVHRHVPAAEIHHARAGGAVEGVERCGLGHDLSGVQMRKGPGAPRGSHDPSVLGT